MTNLFPGLSLSSPQKNIFFSGLYPDTFSKAWSLSKNLSLSITDHLYHLAVFFNDLQSKGFSLSSQENIYDLLILSDAPNDAVWKQIKQLNFKTIIFLCSESPKYQGSTFSDIVQLCDYIISPYCYHTFPEKKYIQSATSFLYKSIPSIAPSTTQESIPRDFNYSIICSNLYGNNSNMYGLRRSLVNLTSNLFPDTFMFYGRGWKAPSRLSLDNFLLIKNEIRSKFYDFPAVDLSLYLGPCQDKSVLLNSSTTFAIENFIDVPGYSTEKFFEPLIYNCLPIYCGTSQSNFIANFSEIISPNADALLSSAYFYVNKESSRVTRTASDIRESINLYLSTHKNSTLMLLVNLFL